MAVKEQVRERRRNRIQEIVSKRGTSWFGGERDGARERREAGAAHRTSAGPAMPTDDRLHDPEYAWKFRDNPWQRGTQGEWNDYDRWLTVSIRLQLVISIFLFAIAWLVFAADPRLSWVERTQETMRTALTEPADFGAVTGWYEHRFAGSPAILPSMGGPSPAEAERAQAEFNKFHQPVASARIVTGFEESGKGLTLSVPAGSSVDAVDEGRVVFAAPPAEGERGWTVVIQHAGGVQSIYGRIAESSVTADDWVESGQMIGKAGSNEGASVPIYFAIKRGDAYMNPRDVIPFD